MQKKALLTKRRFFLKTAVLGIAGGAAGIIGLRSRRTTLPVKTGTPEEMRQQLDDVMKKYHRPKGINALMRDYASRRRMRGREDL